MGFIGFTRGRQTEQAVASGNVYTDEKPREFYSQESAPGSDSDDRSLEAKEEAEVQRHPNQITQNAELGVQKAEAAALVWTKTSLYLTFAWSVDDPSHA